MPTVHFRFHKVLENFDYSDDHFGPRGPLFTGWLPNGRGDAIDMHLPDESARLLLWFERRGFVDGGMIRYDQNRKEVDPAIMQLQGRLEAGPLSGILVLNEVSDATCEALKMQVLNNLDCIKLAKRFLKILQRPVSRFIKILKVNYGQYWLEDLQAWDSRCQSLGSFCEAMFVHWSADGGATWEKLRTTERVITDIATFLTDYSFYLEEADWKQIAVLMTNGYEPTVAAQILAHAHHRLDQEQLKYAIIEGVSALEISLDEYIRTGFQGRSRQLLTSDRFSDLNLPTKTAIIAGNFPSLKQQDIENTFEIIQLRNEIVHDGHDPAGSHAAKLRSLFEVVRTILKVPNLKFPILNAGNRVGPPTKS